MLPVFDQNSVLNSKNVCRDPIRQVGVDDLLKLAVEAHGGLSGGIKWPRWRPCRSPVPMGA